ncbi:unnamed protein product, partial [Trichogramma brassicae]
MGFKKTCMSSKKSRLKVSLDSRIDCEVNFFRSSSRGKSANPTATAASLIANRYVESIAPSHINNCTSKSAFSTNSFAITQLRGYTRIKLYGTISPRDFSLTWIYVNLTLREYKPSKFLTYVDI